MRACHGAAFVFCALAALSPLVSANPRVRQGNWIETVLPRMPSGAAQLAHARFLKRQLASPKTVGRKTGELDAWCELTVRAYQAVRLFHPEDKASAVEGAFRAGELLRAEGSDARALEEFRWSAENGGGSAFRARARLEIGHIHRRAERWREALESYLDVASDAEASAVRREDAWLWAGTAWSALGRADEARLAWQRVAERGTDPLARITAFDELALLLVAAGDLEGAAGVLDRCVRALSPRAMEETETGERVRNALLRMRVVAELPRAIARRNSEKVLTR